MPLRMPTHERTPRWGNYKTARTHSGLSIRLLQDYVKDGLIRSSVVTKPGASRGVRLIDLNSLDAFIEAGIGAKTELAMNFNRRAPALSNNNFHPKATAIENNVFNSLGRGNWSSCIEGVQEGMAWTQKPWETVSVEMLRKNPGVPVDDLPSGRSEKAAMRDRCLATVTVGNQSCTELTQFADGSHDLVITDPPFGGLLHYPRLPKTNRSPAAC